MAARILRIATHIALLPIIGIASYSAYSSVIQWNGNIHMVEQNTACRSAQLSPAKLERINEKRAIRGILGLHGGTYGSGSTMVTALRHPLIRLKARTQWM